MNIHLLRTVRVSALTLLAAVGAPAAAAARPIVTTDRACYSEGEPVLFTGQGFTPSGEITLTFGHNDRIGDSSTTADTTGAFQHALRAAKLEEFAAEPPAFDMWVTANDQAKLGPDGPIGPPEDTFAATQIRISEWTADIREWNTARSTARRGQRVKLTTRGWTSTGDALYIHYLRGGKAAHSEKVGALKAPCGDLTKTIRTFNYKTAKAGTYAVRFSTSPKWSGRDAWLGYRAVRLAT